LMPTLPAIISLANFRASLPLAVMMQAE
jgi:hypothetical protein